MRIIAGEAKGRRLTTAPGLNTRPTADRVKEALFSVLSPCIAGARVLDAFAGSGALGLEALSRGAAHALFMEHDAAALKALRRNIEACDLPGVALQEGDTLRLLQKLPKGQWDVIFLDPPYNRGLLKRALDIVAQAQLLTENGLVVAESSAQNSEFALPPGWETFKHSVYGDTALYYCRKAAELSVSSGRGE